MGKILATVHKEILQLIRDRAGLLVLFLMPSALVVIITLVQENILKTTGDLGIKVLYLDRDGGDIGKDLGERLAESGAVQVETAPPELTPAAAREKLNEGEYQFCLIVPEGFSAAVRDRVAQSLETAFPPGNAGPDPESTDPASGSDATEPLPDPPELILIFDPLVQGAFRSAVVGSLERMVAFLEMEMKIAALAEALPGRVDGLLAEILGAAAPQGVFRLDPAWGRTRMLALRTERGGAAGFDTLPTSVQQNVPAWALFGMFFIVVPLGGSLLRERRDGTLRRIMTLPVSRVTPLCGKVLAYVLVCLCQFGIILAIGTFVLPLLGTPRLEIGDAPGAIALVVTSAALAAAGYGVLVGTLARTYEQASMFGAVSVVIAAALGGVMVPVYVMPELMRHISAFSPLAWGLTALTDLFARGADLSGVLPKTGLLLSFSAVCILAGWWSLVGRETRDR
jgi:ABC-2 type transport system permease protein